MKKCLVLSFAENQLIETYFDHPILAAPVHAVRGKSGGAHRGYGSFQWTSAVQAICVLLLGSVACDDCRQDIPCLSGVAGSLAASLDYATDKSPVWILDMFGCGRGGEPILKRMLLRTNPNRKRPGPVTIRLNTQFLQLSDVIIVIDGAPTRVTERIQGLIAAILTVQEAVNTELPLVA